jgi:hypothetical protein
MLLSLTPSRLFANALGPNAHAVVATAPGGRSVVAWQTQKSATDHDIKAQIFDATGHKVGSVITVIGDRANEHDPTVAVNANGQFVVAWVLDFTAADKDVRATLFRANGTRVRSNFSVAWSPKAEFTPRAGIDARGDVDVSYTVQFGPADTDVKAAMFNAAGTFRRTVGVAASPKVEVNTGITVAPAGNFAVSYTSAGTRLVRHFSSTGSPLDAGVRPTPTPTPTPTPAPRPVPKPAVPTLRGTVAGGYFVTPLGTGRGKRYDLVGIGSLAGLGELTLSGYLTSTGSALSSHATGALTLRRPLGTVTLTLVGPAQGPNAALPAQFHYTVTAGTGSYLRLRSTGVVNLHLNPFSHTLTLDIAPSV